MTKKINIAILSGGLSGEREVSIKSGENVKVALEALGYNCRMYDPKTDLIKIIEDRNWISVIFPVLHGKYGEDGTIQGFCELLDLPYVGSGVLASALAIDKMKTIEMYKVAGLPVAKSVLLDETNIGEIKKLVGFPCVVKPVAGGSSIDVEIVENQEKLKEVYGRVKKIDDSIMAEEYILGEEITVGVIGNSELEALPVLSIKPKSKFFDYEAKYNGETEEKEFTDIELIAKAQDYAIRAHKILGCRGLSRTDMIISNGEAIILETNTMPGMTSESLFPKAGKASGLSFNRLVDRLILLALEGKDGLS